MNSTFYTLSIGTKIELIKSNGDEEISYPSQVLDIIEPDELIVSGPIRQNNLAFMHKGENVKVLYNVEDKGMHYFISKVISRDYSSIYVIKLKKISDIKKNQKRRYYRVFSTLNVNKEYELTKNDETDILSETCRASDISGGGMKLYCNYRHELGDKISCSFKIYDSKVNVKGNVVRIDEIDSFNYKYSIGISFLDIPEETRDIIIKYIFEQQRILRVKGLI